MCLEDIRKLCQESKTKTEALHCLSEAIVKNQNSVSQKCRAQLKNELIEQVLLYILVSVHQWDTRCQGLS